MLETGLDVWVADGFRKLAGLRVGLLAHPASVDRSLVHVVDRLSAAGVRLVALFGPEHGVNGEAQDMEPVDGEAPIDPRTGAKVYSLYGHDEASLYPTEDALRDLDVLVVDLQDVGARYYTFAATMVFAMQVAAKVGRRVVVLDRPNPIGGVALEGPPIDAGFRSFVGAFDLPIRHGLTIGEYARLVAAEEKIDVDLEVVPMRGYRRDMLFGDTGLPWVLPSPNMPTPDTALVYPGQCLLEGTNLSEGRGTTRPFQLSGAPFLDPHRWAALAGPHTGPGIVLRPTIVKPTFHKWAKQRIGAVEMHVTDPRRARSLTASVALLWAARQLAPRELEWRTEVYEFVKDRLAIDLLFGSPRPREALDGGAEVEEIVAGFAANERAFAERRRPWLAYA